MLACGPQKANREVREPKWLRMARMKTGSDGDEYEDEDDNDGKASQRLLQRPCVEKRCRKNVTDN